VSLAALRVGLSLLFFFGRRDLSLFIHPFLPFLKNIAVRTVLGSLSL